MLRKILSLCLSCAIVLCMASCHNKKSENESTGIRFIKENTIEYNNGCVFGSNPAMFLDFETLDTSPICAVPNCSHSNLDCLAKQIGNTPVFYNKYIYFIESNNGEILETEDGNKFYIESKLKKASLDSSEIEVVCEFNDCAPEQGAIGLVLNDNELYFTADNLNPNKSEYGGYSWGNSGGVHFLCSINLDTGEYTNYGSIYDGDKQYDGAAYSSCANITGIYKDKMYIRYSFIKDNEALQSGNSDIDSLYEHINFEFDFESKTWKESELPFSWFMNNETYSYYDDNSKEMHIIYNDNDTSFPCEDSKTELKEFNGKLFVHNISTDYNTLYDLTNMTEYSLGEYAKYDIMGYYNDSYIFRKGVNTIKLTEKELLTLTEEN